MRSRRLLVPNKKQDRRKIEKAFFFWYCSCFCFVILVIAPVVIPICLQASKHTPFGMVSAFQTQTLHLGSNDMLNVGDVITIETVVLNTGNVRLKNLLVTDSSLVGTLCEPDFVNNTISVLEIGNNATCVGSYTVMQLDIDAQMFTLTSNISNALIALTTVSSKSNLTDPAIDAFTVTQTQHLCLGEDDMLNAGDVIQVETVIFNTGTTTLENLTVTDNVPLGTICQTAGMDNIVPLLLSGENVTCFGMHIITQMDIDAHIFVAMSNISSPILAHMEVQSSTNLTQTTFGDISLNQMASVDLGSDDFLNAGDVVAVTVYVFNSGTETLLNVTTASFNGILSMQLLPMQSVNYTYFIVLDQAALDLGTLFLNETATGIGTTSALSVVAESLLQVNVTQTEEGRLRLQTTFANTTKCAQLGDVVMISVAVENFGTVSLFNVNVQNTLVGPALVCGMMGVDNVITELMPGQTIMCNGGYMLMGSDRTPGIDTLLVSNSSANGEVFEQDLEYVYKAVDLLYFSYTSSQTGITTGFSTVDFLSQGSGAGTGSRNPLACDNGFQNRAFQNMNSRSFFWRNFNVHPRHLFAELRVIDLDTGSAQIITVPANLFTDWRFQLLGGVGTWNPSTGILTRSSVNVNYFFEIDNLVNLTSIQIRFLNVENSDFLVTQLAEIVDTTRF